MNTTNSSYQEDPYNSKDELIAQLTININKNEDFLCIIETIKDFVMSTEKNKDENSGGDSLAVSPRDVLKL